MKEKFLENAKKEYNPRQRLFTLSILAIIFLFLLPFILVTLGSKLDRWLQWPTIEVAPANLILGVLMIAIGWLFGLWSNYVQFTFGRGTPVPLMATQKLIVQPPYNYCRNPMTLGAIVMYLGVAILFGSIGAVVLVFLGAVCLLTYIKKVEEKEMVLRFGQEYLDYRKRTPFLIPHFPRQP